MITNTCNLNCSYCFANEYVNKYGNGHIDLAELQYILNWSKHNGERIGLIGGEPTIHPRFRDIMKMCIESAEAYHQEILVFTNGTTLKGMKEYLVEPNVHCLINVNDRKTLSEEKFRKLKDELKMCKQERLQSKISLGINLYSPDQDFSDFFEIFDCMPCKSIRLGITVPNTDDKRSKDPINYFKEMAPALLRLMRDCVKRNTMVMQDCNVMPSCIMTEEQKEEFNRLMQEYSLATGEVLPKKSESLCSPVLDVKQDLTVIRCFGMSDAVRVPIYQFDTPEDARKFFIKTIDNLATVIPTSPECAKCKKFNTGDCFSGCLGFKKDRFQQVRQGLNDKYKLEY